MMVPFDFSLLIYGTLPFQQYGRRKHLSVPSHSLHVARAGTHGLVSEFQEVIMAKIVSILNVSTYCTTYIDMLHVVFCVTFFLCLQNISHNATFGTIIAFQMSVFKEMVDLIKKLSMVGSNGSKLGGFQLSNLI